MRKISNVFGIVYGAIVLALFIALPFAVWADLAKHGF